ncbi:MAG: 50S ribosome-binding GTPase [Thermoguttaceae bacterium]|nr:50S ribosome-binding GTPase [Thermoguttaceae bacterium]
MTKVKKPQIGLVGCFQNGKSTLTNCLLQNRVALTGEGVSKTKKVTRYVYAKEVEYRLVGDDGNVRTTDRATLETTALSDQNDGVAFCEIALPATLLHSVDLVDTPGFDANDKDTERTIAYLKNVDFLFFVIGGGGNRGALNDAERRVLRRLVETGKPFSILYNCCDGNNWNPCDEATRACVQSLNAGLRNVGVDPFAVDETGLVLPVNLAWYWTALVLGGLDERGTLFDETDAERRVKKQVVNYFFDDGLDANVLRAASNIDAVMRYVATPPNPIAFLKARLPQPILTLMRVDEETRPAARLVWTTGDAAERLFELQTRIDDGEWRVQETAERELNVALKWDKKYEFRVRAKDARLNLVSEFSEIVTTTADHPGPKVRLDFSEGRGGMFD